MINMICIDEDRWSDWLVPQSKSTKRQQEQTIVDYSRLFDDDQSQAAKTPQYSDRILRKSFKLFQKVSEILLKY